MKCINLRERFGERFRISYDPAAEVEIGLKRDPWYLVIKYKTGSEICPNGGQTLRLEVPRKRQAATRSEERRQKVVEAGTRFRLQASS